MEHKSPTFFVNRASNSSRYSKFRTFILSPFSRIVRHVSVQIFGSENLNLIQKLKVAICKIYNLYLNLSVFVFYLR